MTMPVLYNDYVVSEIIKKTKISSSSSSLIYFSDHGEEIFDQANFHGHVEANSTQNMFDIPFIVWLAPDKIEHQTKLKSHMQTPFVTDDIIHTLLDLYGINHSKYDSSRSLLGGFVIKSVPVPKLR
jgi:heptose-I-phosphate ethanolaminephosphotransferase